MKESKKTTETVTELPDKLKWTGNEWDSWAKGHTFSFLTHSVTLNDIFIPAGYYFSNYGVISSKYVLEHTKSWAAIGEQNG